MADAESVSWKRCPGCGDEKILTEGFSRNRSRPDGRQGYCRVCMSKAETSWRLANPDRARRIIADTRKSVSWMLFGYADTTTKRQRPQKEATNEADRGDGSIHHDYREH